MPTRDPEKLRVLIVDDEPLGCRRIVNLLNGESSVQIIGTAEDGDAAVEAVLALRPDLVFLDIQMPRKTGLQVVHEVGPENMPVTIFVTAYNEFAIRAFELAAVDYLVKPFENDRFEQALHRARRRIQLERVETIQAQIRSLLASAIVPDCSPQFGGPAEQQSIEKAGPRYLERIAVHMRGKTRMVAVSEIDYIAATGDYAELHAGESRLVVRETLQRLEQQLDPRCFIRIHRSAIVRLSLIDTLLRGEGGEYRVLLKNGVMLKVSRYRREALEQRLGKPR